MKKLNEPQITAKCVEISKCLLNTEVGLIDYDLAATRSIGDAARLAVSIKQLQEPVSLGISVYKDVYRAVRQAESNAKIHGKSKCYYLERGLRIPFDKPGGLGYWALRMRE